MKKIIMFVITAFIITILMFQLFKIYNINQKQVPILVYHNIVEEDSDKLNDTDALTAQEFTEQLKYLRNNEYTTISLEELYKWKKNEIDIPEKSVVITFDDGYMSFKHLVQPILKQYDFKAACFLIGNITGTVTSKYEKNKYAVIGLDEVENKANNIIYGSHTFDFHNQTSEGKPIVTEKTYEEIKEDTQKFNNTVFEAKYLAYPYYTYTKEYVKVLKEEKYNLAFAGENEMATKNVNNYKVPRISGVKNLEEFRKIFETDMYRNKYGNGLIRKICVTTKKFLTINIE